MQDPFPHQGVVNTQQQTPHTHPSRGNPHNNPNHDIFMIGEDILLQTHNQNYEAPSEPSPSTSTTTIPTVSLTIPRDSIESMPKMVKGPLWCIGHNSKVSHSYNIVDELAQPSSTMSALEVL